MPKPTLGDIKKNALGKTFLREWREAAGLSSEEAAEIIGVSRPTIERKEQGKSPYDQHYLEAAARAYRTSPAAILSCQPGSGAVPDLGVDRLGRDKIIAATLAAAVQYLRPHLDSAITDELASAIAAASGQPPIAREPGTPRRPFAQARPNEPKEPRKPRR